MKANETMTIIMKADKRLSAFFQQSTISNQQFLTYPHPHLTGILWLAIVDEARIKSI